MTTTRRSFIKGLFGAVAALRLPKAKSARKWITVYDKSVPSPLVASINGRSVSSSCTTDSISSTDQRTTPSRSQRPYERSSRPENLLEDAHLYQKEPCGDWELVGPNGEPTSSAHGNTTGWISSQSSSSCNSSEAGANGHCLLDSGLYCTGCGCDIACGYCPDDSGALCPCDIAIETHKHMGINDYVLEMQAQTAEAARQTLEHEIVTYNYHFHQDGKPGWWRTKREGERT